MRENLKLGGILLGVTMIAGILLGAVNNLTKDAILENSKINKDDLRLIMKEANKIEDTDFELGEDDGIKEVYLAKSEDKEVGYVFKVTTKGFHGPIDMFVGVAEDKLSGMKISSHTETPGLGARIEEEEFRAEFTDKLIEKSLEIVKMEPAEEHQIDGISGATVSSKAVGTAVNEVINFYRENIKGEEVDDEIDATTGASESDW
ncbi:RnfABCDGE type electron transport complex subunit G [uncultured Clostridium sp.]|uniref:RnfABCDGE type electron transport complex subunit G n=1 Tax=uncultured Clostridium sp. TaxID=59620 RepID=UPI00261671EB|nr:RnfABCDGE type electron transport complex subunit G [uncultured Clostridium sp.]